MRAEKALTPDISLRFRETFVAVENCAQTGGFMPGAPGQAEMQRWWGCRDYIPRTACATRCEVARQRRGVGKALKCGLVGMRL